MTVATITLPFRGRDIKIAGDRSFTTWTTNVFNDTNFKLRNAFERWQNGINNMSDGEGLTNPADYQVDLFVDQLDRNGATLKSYTLRGCFPESISDISLAYGQVTDIEKFDVVWQYQFFESNTTT